jgi:hypothetical protein
MPLDIPWPDVAPGLAKLHTMGSAGVDCGQIDQIVYNHTVHCCVFRSTARDAIPISCRYPITRIYTTPQTWPVLVRKRRLSSSEQVSLHVDVSGCLPDCASPAHPTGIFGVSTALWMYKRGGYAVTILDKASVLPAPDAASTDINKIIRSGDYADPTIAALNVDAVNEWRKPEWEGTYHE